MRVQGGERNGYSMGLQILAVLIGNGSAQAGENPGPWVTAQSEASYSLDE